VGASDAIGRPDVWLPFETVAALAAAASVGFAIGTHLPNVAAPPVAALVVFAAPTAGASVGLLSLFAPMGLSSSVVGLSRDPESAALLIALNLTLAVACCTLALRGPGRARLWSAGAALMAVAFVALAALPATDYDFRPDAGPATCVTEGRIRTCGPEAAGPLVRELSRGLNQTLDIVTGLPFPTTFELGVPGAPVPVDEDRAVAFISPADLRGEDRIKKLADVLALPRVCPQLVQFDEDTTRLLERQADVRSWIVSAIREGGGAAPAEIRAAYNELSNCRPSRP
jgi:hypothetical protein